MQLASLCIGWLCLFSSPPFFFFFFTILILLRTSCPRVTTLIDCPVEGSMVVTFGCSPDLDYKHALLPIITLGVSFIEDKGRWHLFVILCLIHKKLTRLQHFCIGQEILYWIQIIKEWIGTFEMPWEYTNKYIIFYLFS